MEEGEEAPLEDNSQSEKDGGTSDREGSMEGDLSSSPSSESKFSYMEGPFGKELITTNLGNEKFSPEVQRVAMVVAEEQLSTHAQRYSIESQCGVIDKRLNCESGLLWFDTCFCYELLKVLSLDSLELGISSIKFSVSYI